MNTRRQIILSLAIVGTAAGAVGVYSLIASPEQKNAATSEHANHGAMAGAGTNAPGPVQLTADAARRIGVTYATAEHKSLMHEVRAVGNVTPNETQLANVNPKIEGWAERLYVNFTGAPVSRGQPLLEVYSPMLVAAQEELILARRLVDESSAGGSERAAENARELLESARRRLRYLDIPAATIAQVERSGTPRRTLAVTSPASGIVVEKNVVQGMRIMPGMDIYKIADLSRVWVEVDVFEKDFSLIRLGQHAVITFEGYPGEQWESRVSYIYPTLNVQSRTGRVRLELANPGGRIKPGMYAQVLLHLATPHLMVVVPRTAVLQTGERAVVFVRGANGALTPREVRVGMVSGNDVQIVAGIQPGEVVVSSASFLIDAESNLGAAVGAMPGMDTSTPAGPAEPAQSAPGSSHAGH